MNSTEPHFDGKASIITLPTENISGNMARESLRRLEGFEGGDSFRVSPTMDVGGPSFQCLSPLEPRQRHKELQSSRLDGVGNRFLETVEFRKWSGSEGGDGPAFLFCCGDLGTGKSHLNSLVVDSLCNQARTDDIAVAGVYCDSRGHMEQSTLGILGAILKQLMGEREIPEDVLQAFQRAKRESGSRGLRVPNLTRMLRATIALIPRVFICIDALDEVHPKHLSTLLTSLQGIARESPNTRIFLTGRAHIIAEVKKEIPRVVVAPANSTEDDIETYLKMKLGQDLKPGAMDDDLRADILRLIPEKCSPILLLVSLAINAILEQATISQRREKLCAIIKGEGLDDAYTPTLERIKAQEGSESKLGMEALMWISHSERPLHARELCHALGIEQRATDLDTRNVPTIERVLRCTLGFIAIDAPTSTVHLVHSTLQEHLSYYNSTLFHSPHSMIAEVCLTYLNFREVKDLSPTLPSAPPTTPFVEYASYYWGVHARRKTTESMIPLAVRLLDEYDKHISSKLLLLHDTEDRSGRPFNREDDPTGFTGLHGAARLGVAEILIALLELKEWDLNATDFEDRTALAWAAGKGCDEVLGVLLKRQDVNPNTVDTYGQTPLSWAAKKGHLRVVKLLLKQGDVNPNSSDSSSRTPLLWAAHEGHESVVKLLLKHDNIDHNTSDSGGRTPLSWAAYEGHERVVNLLLKRDDARPDHPDNIGRTPLSWAAHKGHEGVVKLLLDCDDVNPVFSDDDGQTPLSWAAYGGHTGVVKILLKSNPEEQNDTTSVYRAAAEGHEDIVRLLLNIQDDTPDPGGDSCRFSLSWAAAEGHADLVQKLLDQDNANANSLGINNRTPLSLAAAGGHEMVVQVLLDSENVDHSRSDHVGQTPLSWAARNGHEGALQLLLDHEAATPNSTDHDGRTPLSWAAGNGHTGALKLLLDHEAVTPNSTDGDGRTPLSWAAGTGHEQVLRLLLNHKSVTLNSMDNTNRTPFSWAAGNGHGRALRLLLGHEAHSSDQVDCNNRTPLSWAAGNGHESTTKLLLRQQNVNPNLGDNSGRTPLSWAVGNGHKAPSGLLLRQKNVDPNAVDEVGQTPLFWATIHKQDEAVGWLLGSKNVNANQRNQHGRTPLSWAAEHGYGVAVRLLLDREDISLNSQDGDDRTPLSWAVGNGHEEIVELLTAHGGIDLNLPDNKSQTPLLWAVREKREGIIKLLLSHPATNPNTRDKQSRTPLLCAAETGNEEILKLLLARTDINLNSADNRGRTPLFRAVQNKYEGVVRLLLEGQHLDPNARDIDGRTALSWAALNGHEAIVEQLLKCKHATADALDKNGQTPITLASKKGHQRTVRMLLARYDVNPNSQDHYQRTPLFWASLNGQSEVVELLLDRPDVDSNLVDVDGRSPADWADTNGHTAIAEALKQRVSANPLPENSPTPGQPSLYPRSEHTPGLTNWPTQPPILVSSVAGRLGLNGLGPTLSDLAEGGDAIFPPSLPLSDYLATHLVDCCLRVFSVDRRPTQCQCLSRFRLWADEYGTPHSQLDKILKESPIIKEATITILADLCNILTTQTSHSDDTLHEECRLVLEYARTIYPGISQSSLNTDSDSSGEEDEIETIVDSLFNLSPLLLDILENLPRDTPTNADSNGKVTAASEVAHKFDASAYASRLRISRFLVLGCLLLVHLRAGHAAWLPVVLENLRRDWFG